MPIGVVRRKNRFVARVSEGQVLKHLVFFDDENKAFMAYKVEKERRIKELARKWKGEIEPRVYQALLNYKVEIDD